MHVNDTPKQPGSAAITEEWQRLLAVISANQKKTERYRVGSTMLRRGKKWLYDNHDDIVHDTFFPEHSPDDLKEVRIELEEVLLKYVNILKQHARCDHNMQTIHCRKGCYEVV